MIKLYVFFFFKINFYYINLCMYMVGEGIQEFILARAHMWNSENERAVVSSLLYQWNPGIELRSSALV